MAELGHNFKIQKEKLFQELKAAFPNVPDPAVRQIMKQNRNDKVRCEAELRAECRSHGQGRYNMMNKALLSHQMDQLLKLNKQLAEGKKEVEEMRIDIKGLETTLKQQEIIMQSEEKRVVVEVRQLETDISGLRGACDDMSKTVSTITAGKVPLGETSIKFENYLIPAVPEQEPTTPPTNRVSLTTWPCSECTFNNHRDLEHCEMCEMPRIQLG